MRRVAEADARPPSAHEAASPTRSRRRGQSMGARAQVCACLSCACVLTYVLDVFWLPAGPALEAAAVAASPPAPPRVMDSASPQSAEVQPVRVLSYPTGLRVPKLIHQSWRDGGFPKGLFNWRWQQGLLDLNPGWKLMKWTDESSREFIAREYAWFLPTYDAYPSYIQRCDAARYFIVYHHGGVYADLDIECSKPFAPVLSTHRAIFSYKQGTNMSRGLVNALFASEPRHPIWHTVFDLLANRSAAGAAAATHVEVVRSTGPGLLREAVLQHMGSRHGGNQLAEMGVELLDSSVWHPIMPEQKRGRDASSAAAEAIARSHCYHHFVSSWMTHDKDKHGTTDSQRQGYGDGDEAGGRSRRGRRQQGTDRASKGTASVPVGQGLRLVNPWKSYQLAGHGNNGESNRDATTSTADERATRQAARKGFVRKAYEKRMERRRRAMGEID